MRKIKLIIFDLDGTLVDAYKAVSSSLNHAFKKLDLPKIDDYTIQRRVGWGEKILVQAFVPQRLLDRALSLYRRHHKTALTKGTKFLPGAKRLLQYLKKNNYRLAVASNRPTPFTRIILRTLKIESYFQHVLCADKVKNPKPAPDLIKHILRRSNCTPGEAFYVGDMAIDVEAGNRARVKTVAVVTGSSTRKEILMQRPFRIIKSIGDLTKIIEQSGRKTPRLLTLSEPKGRTEGSLVKRSFDFAPTKVGAPLRISGSENTPTPQIIDTF